MTALKIRMGTDEVELEDVDGDGARFLGTLYILGVPHHMELIQVMVGRDHVQHAVSPMMESSLDAMWEIGAEGAFQTIELDGKEYVCNVIPHQ
jgi:hypothetical protein